MQHIQKYNDFISEGWLSDKLQSLSTGAKAVLSTFNQSFGKMMDDVKSTWKEIKDQEQIKTKFIKVLEASYNAAILNIDKLTTEEELIKVLDDMKQSIVHLKDMITKELGDVSTVKESMLNENVTDLKYTLGGLLTSVSKALADFRTSYIEELKKQQDFNSKRKIAKELLKNEFLKVKSELEKMSIKDIINKEKTVANVEPNIEYIAGTILVYKKKDGTQATGMVVSDQSEAEDGYVAMSTLDRKSNFAVPKVRILGKAKVNPTSINWNKVDKTNSVDMNKMIKNYFQFTNGLADTEKLNKIINIINSTNK